MTTPPPPSSIDTDPNAAWQDGYNLGLTHGEQMVDKPTLWLWVLLGMGIVIGLELLILFAAFIGIAVIESR